MRAFEELIYIMITMPPLLFLAGVFVREIMEAVDVTYRFRRFVRLLRDPDFRAYIQSQKAQS